MGFLQKAVKNHIPVRYVLPPVNILRQVDVFITTFTIEVHVG